MLFELTDRIKDLIEANTSVPVEYYKGEFEENAEWNPEFPSIKISLHSIIPENLNSDNSSSSLKCTAYVYSAFEENDAPQTETANNLLTTLNKIAGLAEGEDYIHKGTVIYAYMFGVVVYRSEIEFVVMSD